MAVDVQWYLENRILKTTLTGNIKVEDMYAHDIALVRHMSETDEIVHVIVDVHQIGTYPTSINQIYQSASRYLQRDNMGWLVIVGFGNPFIRLVAGVVVRLTNAKFHETRTLDEAMTWLKKVDSSLN